MNQFANDLMELAALHNNNLGVLQQISTGGQLTPTAVINRPWVEPPDGYVSYDESGKVALPLVGSTATVVSFVVPDGYDGVINAYSWNFVGAGFTNGSGDIVVKILRDGAPIRNYDNILVQKGSPEIARPLLGTIRVWSKQVISLVVTHSATVALNGDVVASFMGYFYPSQA